ncbi:MAG: ABC transporter ATP-binding protein [Pseudomonadota bacterium]
MSLKVDNLTAGYGRIEVLHRVSLSVGPGEIVAIVGANGAGKTTLMHTIAGVHPVGDGHLSYGNVDLTRAPPHQRVAAGIALVPEGRQVFGPLSVRDNLRLGAFRRSDDEIAADLADMEALFPILGERARQAAARLSGGQQQMLAIARALMARPSLLLLDEPSMGLAPMIVAQIFDALRSRHEAGGVAILLVEQNVSAALRFAERALVLETGRVSAEGPSEKLLADDTIQKAYLGH